MAPAQLLNPQPGDRVLDLCAAPGGKSTQLGDMLEGQGLLVANEINPKRAKILSRNIERMGIPNALVLNMHPRELEGRFHGLFDKILVDAPCSGEGMFRKEAAAVTDWSPDTVSMCAGRQKEILDSAAKMLRPGAFCATPPARLRRRRTREPLRRSCGATRSFMWKRPICHGWPREDRNGQQTARRS